MMTLPALARLAKVSEKTLRHYEKIGLLHPAERKEDGTRLYGRDEMLTLQSILAYKLYGFSLSDIKELMEGSGPERLDMLSKQLRLLNKRRREMESVISTLQNTVITLKEGKDMPAEKIYENFPDMRKYREEAIDKWGEEVYETEERLAKLSKDDMQALQEEGLTITRMIAGEMDKDPSSDEVQKLISLHYKYMQKFYEVPKERYIGLADMYLDDARFTKYYEDIKSGLSDFISNAMKTYAKENL